MPSHITLEHQVTAYPSLRSNHFAASNDQAVYTWIPLEVLFACFIINVSFILSESVKVRALIKLLPWSTVVGLVVLPHL